MEKPHTFVTMGLGQDRCGRNVCKSGVTLHKCQTLPVTPLREAVAIDNHGPRQNRQRVESTMHCEYGGPQDINPVDLASIDNPYGPCDSLTLDNRTEPVALSLGQLFGIIKEGMMEIIGEDDSRRKNRTGETPSSGLITTGLVSPGNIADIGQQILSIKA